jgi:DNA (cytosine-5)-methyltransferase 1
MSFLLDNKKIELDYMTDKNNIVCNIYNEVKEMDLSKLSKTELLEKCEELGIKKCKSKNKSELIDLINQKQKTSQTNSSKKIEFIIEDDNSIDNNLSTPLNICKWKFIDLFCGIGGFHRGFIDFECVFACDINEQCRKTYYDNYGVKPGGDIFSVKTLDIPQHNILCAGFPCQPFSSAGKQQGLEDERSKVYDKLIEIINVKQPNIIILENVKNLTIIDGGSVFKKIQEDLTNLNYNVTYSILNVSDFGLPQNRERIFIIGINKFYQNRQFNFEYLKSVKINKSLKDVIDLSNDNYIDKNKYIILEDKHIVKQKSGLIFCGYIKGNIRTNGALPNTEHLSRVHKQPNRIYHIDGVNPTLSSSESSGRYYIYDNKGVRTLTLNECYSIMGFNDFNMNIKKNVCYNQIGNSVCPVIIKYIKDELINQQFILI